MKKFSCPSCGAETNFQSNLSVYAVCRYCSSMIVRRDVDVATIGTMAALPDDMSPLQIGTEGFYRRERFNIIGRHKIGWEDGVWNEWFLIMDGGRQGWLAEAQGSYAISFEVQEKLNLQPTTSLDPRFDEFFQDGPNTLPKPGSYISLNNQKYKIADIKQSVCLGSEGELPFAAPQGRKTLSVDLLGSNGGFGSVEILDGKQRVYLGEYVEWDDMRCQNLRTLEGWS